MLNACRFLHYFQHVRPEGEIPQFAEGRFGTYNPESDWRTMSDPQKYEQDRIVLLEFLADLATIRMAIPYPVPDVFSRGIDEMLRTGEVPLYLVVATQIFLDIHHIVGSKTPTAFRDFFRKVTEV